MLVVYNINVMQVISDRPLTRGIVDCNDLLDGGDFESNLHEQYVRHKLESGLNRLWQDVQARVSTLLVAVPLTYYKFDEFLHVLAVVHR